MQEPIEISYFNGAIRRCNLQSGCGWIGTAAKGQCQTLCEARRKHSFTCRMNDNPRITITTGSGLPKRPENYLLPPMRLSTIGKPFATILWAVITFWRCCTPDSAPDYFHRSSVICCTTNEGPQASAQRCATAAAHGQVVRRARARDRKVGAASKESENRLPDEGESYLPALPVTWRGSGCRWARQNPGPTRGGAGERPVPIAKDR